MQGIMEKQIIYINFDDMNYIDLDSAKTLYQYIKELTKEDMQYFVLIDEIQEVKDWEKVVNSLLLMGNMDVYITGSNSHLLSSELATYIAGRYVEIKIFPLSFSEYLLFREHQEIKKEKFNRYDEFKRYLILGGFPVVHTGNYSQEQTYQIVKDIYSSAVLRDTVQRYKIRNIELLDRVMKYCFDNIGNLFSGKNVSDYFKNQQRKIDLNTVYNYLSALESAFILQKVPRYDMKGKEILKTNEKYYLGDHSLVYALIGYKDRLISGILENIVFLELERRGYLVFIGKMDQKEIDFIGQRRNEKVYVQVSYTIAADEATRTREFTPLSQIQDNYPKYVVTMDELYEDNINGIKHKHIADFLLLKEF